MSQEIETAATFGERLAMLHEQARSEKQETAASAPAPEATDAPEEQAQAEAPAGVEPAAASPQPAADDEVEKAREARRAALRQLQEAERAADARRQERMRQERMQREHSEVEQLKARIAELESYERAFEDPAQLLIQARKRGHDPMKFGEILKESIANPEYIVEKQLESKLSVYEQKLQEAEKRFAQKLAEIENQQRASRAAAAEQAAANELISYTRESSRLAPLSAAFLERHGAESYVTFATNIAQTLPVGCGIERVHDAVEVALEQMQLNSPPVTNAKSKPTQSPAAKGKTVTNQLASQRSTVPEQDDDWEGLSFSERFERLKRRA